MHNTTLQKQQIMHMNEKKRNVALRSGIWHVCIHMSVTLYWFCKFVVPFSRGGRGVSSCWLWAGEAHRTLGWYSQWKVEACPRTLLDLEPQAAGEHLGSAEPRVTEVEEGKWYMTISFLWSWCAHRKRCQRYPQFHSFLKSQSWGW